MTHNNFDNKINTWNFQNNNKIDSLDVIKRNKYKNVQFDHDIYQILVEGYSRRLLDRIG